MTDNPNDPRPGGFPVSPGGAPPPMTPPIAAEGGWGMPPANSPDHPPSPLGPSGTADTGRSWGVPGVTAVEQPASGGIGLLLVGLVLVVVSLVAGGVMLVLAAGQQQTAVEDLARAPVDCLTELDFAETGTFYVYTETQGEVGELDGTCSNADRDYSFDEAPRVTLVLTDEDDEEIELERTSGIEYDTGSFAGTAVRTFEIEDAGSYILRVESRDDDAVVAVGRDVSDAGAALGAAGLVLAVVGVLAGVAVIVVALLRRRRRRATGSGPVDAAPAGAGVWAPAPGAAPVTTPPAPAAPATWGTPPHTVSPGPSAPPAPPVSPAPAPAADDSFWRPPAPPTT